MPTVELFSVHAKADWRPAAPSTFDIIVSRDRCSHRALFQPVYSAHPGTLVHLGNLGMAQQDFGFWGNELFETIEDVEIGVEADEKGTAWPYAARSPELMIKREVRQDFSDLLSSAYNASAINLALFATDYQFGGPAKVQFFDSQNHFWEAHDAKGVFFNTLSAIGESSRLRPTLAYLKRAAQHPTAADGQ